MGDKDNGAGFAIGFFIGAAVGLAIGFLYAPKPGKETRELIKQKAEDLREKAAGAVEKVKETAAGMRRKA